MYYTSKFYQPHKMMQQNNGKKEQLQVTDIQPLHMSYSFEKGLWLHTSLILAHLYIQTSGQILLSIICFSHKTPQFKQAVNNPVCQIIVIKSFKGAILQTETVIVFHVTKH